MAWTVSSYKLPKASIQRCRSPDNGWIQFQFKVNNAQAPDLYIVFTTNPLSIAIGDSAAAATRIPLTNVTSSFDLMLTCEVDSLWIFVNGKPVTSIVRYHSTWSNGAIVPPVLFLYNSWAHESLYITRIAWNFGNPYILQSDLWLAYTNSI